MRPHVAQEGPSQVCEGWVSPPLPESSVASPSVSFAPDAPGASRAHVNLALSIEAPDLDEWSLWSAFESLAVQMSKDLPAAASATALDELQERLVDQVCGPKWAPARCLPAPFAPDRTSLGRVDGPPLRRLDTAAGRVELRLWHVGCRACGKVFAPLLVLMDLQGRRTDRLNLDLADFGCPDVVQPKRSTFSIAPASQSHGSGSPVPLAGAVDGWRRRHRHAGTRRGALPPSGRRCPR